jgi:hypothetical protein
MNNIYIIILLLVIIIVIFLLNKNDNFYSLTEDITAKNITTSGDINTNKINVNDSMNFKIGKSVLQGSPNVGDISWGDGTGWRLNMGKAGAPTMQVYDSGTVQVNGELKSDVITAKKFVLADGSSSSGSKSTEAIQNIASVYNTNNLSATNINATNNLNAGTFTSLATRVDIPDTSDTALTAYINAGCGGNFKNVSPGTTKKMIFIGTAAGPFVAGDITFVANKFWTGTFSKAGGIYGLSGNFNW